jgi:sulfur-oxidizing protein SoxX
MGCTVLGVLALGSLRNKRVRAALKMLVVVGHCCMLAACAQKPTAATEQPRFSDALPEPLTSSPGDPARGREIVVGRDANCLFCHAIPETGERFMGNIGPPLSGVGSRLTAAQLRQRIVDPTRVKRDVAMPAYYRVDGLEQVAQQYRGRPILEAQQVEDVIAYLLTLK